MGAVPAGERERARAHAPHPLLSAPRAPPPALSQVLLQLVAENNIVMTDIINKLGVHERFDIAWKHVNYGGPCRCPGPTFLATFLGDAAWLRRRRGCLLISRRVCRCKGSHCSGVASGLGLGLRAHGVRRPA